MKLKRLLRTLSLWKEIDSVNFAFENYQVFPLHHELLLFCYLLLFISFSPWQVVDRYPQFLVDGPCDVLFPWELKQPGLCGYFCGLCGARGFCTQYYGPFHICSHLLRSLSVADGWNLVCYTKYQRCSEVRTSLPSLDLYDIFYQQHYTRWNHYLYHIDLEKKLLHISALI